MYCQDDNRRGRHEHVGFDFLGFGFRKRSARTKDGKLFVSFLPAISKPALNKISAEVRSWRLHHRTHLTEKDLARKINPIVRGWMQYYGASDLRNRLGACALIWHFRDRIVPENS